MSLQETHGSKSFFAKVIRDTTRVINNIGIFDERNSAFRYKLFRGYAYQLMGELNKAKADYTACIHLEDRADLPYYNRGKMLRVSDNIPAFSFGVKYPSMCSLYDGES